ncbi:MAG: hypothetical protein Q7S52_00660 [bacterium]|nr:hypothetical protein [bacterium]
MKTHDTKDQKTMRRIASPVKTTNLPSPFFPKQFAGFAYVERHSKKPRQGMSQ